MYVSINRCLYTCWGFTILIVNLSSMQHQASYEPATKLADIAGIANCQFLTKIYRYSKTVTGLITGRMHNTHMPHIHTVISRIERTVLFSSSVFDFFFNANHHTFNYIHRTAQHTIRIAIPHTPHPTPSCMFVCPVLSHFTVSHYWQNQDLKC